MDEHYLGTVAIRIYNHIVEMSQQEHFHKAPLAYVKAITMGGPHEPLSPDAIGAVAKKVDELLK